LESNTAGAVVSAADGSIPTTFTFLDVTPNPYVADITAVIATSVAAGSFWTYNTVDARKYIVWYTVDGVGTQPAEAAIVYIQVDLNGAASAIVDTAIAVANKTSLAINSYSMRVPDWRGYFMRVTDDGAGRDPLAGSRTDRGDQVTGDHVGTIQDLADNYNSGGALPSPKNIYANWFIKY
jgi:hypothetical protein